MNYYYARYLKAQGELYNETKKPEEAEKTLLLAQRIIGELYSDSHPIIIDYNAILSEVYALKNTEEGKAKSLQIVDRNLEIAYQYYGKLSIYTNRHELSCVSNKISNGKHAEGQKHVA